MTIESTLQKLHGEGLYREITLPKGLLDFSSNDYLGLSRSEKVRRKLLEAILGGCPLGSTGSRLISGNSEYHEAVEAFLCAQYDSPSALIFGSGYMANLGVMVALGSLGAHFFSDEYNHASLIDGIRLTRSAKTIFRHNDLNDLEEKLRYSQTAVKVIVTESVFSQDGDLLPFNEMLKLATVYNAWLVVDEAHATGVFGDFGLGLTGKFSSDSNRVIAIHTGGKALGAQGAFVISGLNIRKLIINSARSFIYSTAISPLNSLQLQFALEEAMSLEVSRLKIQSHREHFQRALNSKLNVFSASPIIPVILKSNERVLEAKKQLEAGGFSVGAIRSPTVPKGTERLRITLKSFHTSAEVLCLAELLNGVCE